MCTTGAATINGVAYAAETAPIDGNGTYSLVAGCSASGGNMLAATAYGAFASVKGDYGVAMGFGSIAGGSATAVGMQANAGGTGSNAFGFTANAVGNNSVAIGSAATANGSNSIVIGNASTTIAANAVAIGAAATALSNDAVAIGSAASSVASGVAMGKGATVASTDGNNSGVALGNVTTLQSQITSLGGQMADAVIYDSSAHDSVTLGGVGASTKVKLSNVAAGTDAVNGSQLNATNTQVKANTTAITSLQGQTADAVMYDSSAHDSVTLGGAAANTPVALHNVANGAINASSFDAVNGTQLFGVSSALVKALGGGASLQADGSITMPAYAIGGATFHNVGGALTTLDGRVTDLSVAISSGQIGIEQQDPITHTITIGKDVPGTRVDFAGTNGVRLLTGVAAGNIDASSIDAVNGAQLFSISSATAHALGGGAQMNANGTMSAPNYSIGGNNYDNVGGALTDLDGRVSQNAQEISDIKGDVANAVSYDSSAHDSITLGDGETTVSLHNVAAGTANTDAVNVGQMNDAIASVEQVAEAAANPFFAAQGDRTTEGAQATGTHATAAGANAVASGANAVALGANAQAGGANSVALGAGSVADRDNAVSVGSAGNERQITNVAPGTQGTDAVNVNQLTASQAQAQSYTDMRISGVQDQVSDVQRKAYAGTAAAMAVAVLPQPTEAGRAVVALGTSRYGGQTGAAIGIAYVTQNNRWIGRLAGSTSSVGNTGVAVGGAYQW
ncbi:YadA-like family protein [Paraburkholderia sp.]|uniref:YadA family autotransporter adhesin n=1 Tax=Paraburkholderia sp. TaxID=1926495 RepID=UPI00286F8658|nr:YadA-like family protein [Paraburkholderia sp.]